MIIDEKKGGKTLEACFHVKPARGLAKANIYKNLLACESQNTRKYLRRQKPLSRFDPN